jgi:hypothetical protein
MAVMDGRLTSHCLPLDHPESRSGLQQLRRSLKVDWTAYSTDAARCFVYVAFVDEVEDRVDARIEILAFDSFGGGACFN